MTQPVAQEYKTVLKRALQLPLSQRVAMIEALIASFQDALSTPC